MTTPRILRIRSGYIRSLTFFIALILICWSDPLALAQEPDLPEAHRTGEFAAPERHPTVLNTQTLSSEVTQTIIEIPAVADTYIASNQANQNFGLTDGLFLGYSMGGLNYGAERILLQFDVPGVIPADVQINSARLRLYLTFSNPSADPMMDTIVRRIGSPWSETGVTWQTEPVWGGIRASSGVGSSLGWYEWDVTSLVSGWVRGNYADYGLEIIGDEKVQSRERAFYARETTANFYPHLIIDYQTGPEDNLPPSVSVEPLPAFTLSSNFIVRWSGFDQGEEPTGIDYYDVQYRINGGEWTTWLAEVTFTEAQFSGAEDGRTYQFRARGVDEAGNAEPFGGSEAETTVNTSPPRATVNNLPFIISQNSFLVSWTAIDGANQVGILCYDVQYRFDHGPWILWQDCTTATSATFTATSGDGSYQFEARAVDNLGLRETFFNQPEALTVVDAVAPPLQIKRLYLPLITTN